MRDFNASIILIVKIQKLSNNDNNNQAQYTG